jgi:nickel/cobalt transporter (NicO) family protein
MWQIISGSFLLSIIHASIPNHWLPMITLGKTEKWTQRETLRATALVGLAHISSTVLIGLLVGFAGFKLSESYEHLSQWIAPMVLIAIGLIYIGIDVSHKKHDHHHHHHDHSHFNVNGQKMRSKATIISSMALAMFFSPCLELEAYYFQAGTFGWSGIVISSIIYTFITVGLMVLLVYLGSKGLNKLNWHFVEHHEKLLAGLVLIILGLMAFFIEL